MRVHRDAQGYIRVVTLQISYDRLVERAFDKIRQAGRGMPAVMIRQLDALTRDRSARDHATSSARCSCEQAAMIQRAAAESVPAAEDRADVERAYQRVLAATSITAPLSWPPARHEPERARTHHANR